jgi:hypothetical protein
VWILVLKNFREARIIHANLPVALPPGPMQPMGTLR